MVEPGFAAMCNLVHAYTHADVSCIDSFEIPQIPLH